MIKLRIIDTYKGLPKNMYIMFIATIINRFGDFVMPFLTMYLTIKIGLSVGVAGVIVMITSLMGIPSSLLGGKLADEVGRKKIYIISQGGAALTLLPCAFLTNPILIVISLMISTFLRGAARPSMSAMITDMLPPNQRQQGFSLQYLGINVGVALGPIVAGFLFHNLLPLLFIGDALTSIIALFLIWKNVKEVEPEHLQETIYSEKEKEEKGSTICALIKRPQITFFLIVYLFYSFVYTQHSFSLPLTADLVFGEAGASRFGLLMSINAFTVLFCTVAVTTVTKNLKPIINITIAGIFYAIGFGMLSFIQSYPMFILSTIIWTLGEILVVTNFGVYMAENSPSNFRARFSAVGSLSWSIGGALGTSIAGSFIELNGLKSIWLLSIILSLFGAAGMYGIYMTGVRRKIIRTTEELKKTEV
ncbi:MFS transporter [Mobilitalea sibirica]|uniref:MFS transporter n=2 Tax=Mobilitalea sibirica TaxID=1462919 RepID=A0A8J7KVU7_9FIRM|nr:MFS transporter [Mobilitalea sibirica]